MGTKETLQRKFMAHVYLARAKRAHSNMEFDEASVHYLRAAQYEVPELKPEIQAGVQALRAATQPEGLVFMAAPGIYLKDPRHRDLPAEEVYPYAQQFSERRVEIVLVQTRDAALYYVPGRTPRWGARVPDYLLKDLDFGEPQETMQGMSYL